MKYFQLAELAELINGSTPLKSNKKFWDNGTINWFTAEDLKNGNEVTSTKKFITKFALDNTSIKLVPKDSVLLCCTASIGLIGINKIELTTNQQFNAIVPNKELINSRYLFYFLKSYMTEFKKKASTTTVGFISQKKVKSIPVPVPSLQEQEKIVDRLDKVFKNSDISLELKKSIFNEFISYYNLNINNYFTQLEDEITISDYVNDSKNDIVDGPFGSNLKREHFVSRGIEVLKLQDIKENNIYKKSKDYVTKDKFLELIRHSFKPNDLILTKLGNPLGVCAIVKDKEGLIVADLLRVRCKNLLDAKFLMYQINSLAFQKKINSFQRGATRPRIRISDFRNIKIKTCSNKEKKEIVELVEKLDSLKSEYLSNNNLLTNNYLDLKTSVLNKEFVYE